MTRRIASMLLRCVNALSSPTPMHKSVFPDGRSSAVEAASSLMRPFTWGTRRYVWSAGMSFLSKGCFSNVALLFTRITTGAFLDICVERSIFIDFHYSREELLLSHEYFETFVAIPIIVRNTASA